jgi:hypothetical protein
MPEAGFEPAVPTSERSQAYAIERATSEDGSFFIRYNIRTMTFYVAVCSDLFKQIFV